MRRAYWTRSSFSVVGVRNDTNWPDVLSIASRKLFVRWTEVRAPPALAGESLRKMIVRPVKRCDDETW